MRKPAGFFYLGGTTPVAAQENLLEKGFQLAYFIFPSRSAALRILAGALNKLKVQRGRESRRSYWRDKHLKRGITRIIREESDALQWLIFYEADAYEKEQEEKSIPSVQEMVVRYIKNLVRMTTAMSSFYVNVGLHRLVHNYSTAETQRVYEAVTDRYPGADEYRRAKGALMEKLSRRFNGLLKTFRTQHGELRFEAMMAEEQGTWAQLVEACLKAFTPWSTATACPVPRNFDAAQVKLPPRLSGDGTEKIDANEVEINRCHAFIDPICYGRLMEALTFAPPAERLALPRFYMESARHDDTTNQPPRTSSLTEHERKALHDQLADQESRRRRSDPQFVSVVVAGAERARIDLGQQNDRTFQLQEGDEMIELHTSAEGEDLLLAVYPVAYTEWQGIAAAQDTLWRGRAGRLELTITPQPDAGDAQRSAIVALSFNPSPLASWLPGFSSANVRGILPRLALPALALLALGFVAGKLATGPRARQGANAGTALTVKPPPQSPDTHAPPEPGLTAQMFRGELSATLSPDDLATRGEGSPDAAVTIPPQVVLVNLALPVSSDYAHSTFRLALKRFMNNHEILTVHSVVARSSKSGPLVEFPVPAQLFAESGEYVVDLRSIGAGGKLEEVNTYTFQVVKRPR
ncbi:MAG: hypothetical protein LAP21_14815 [Acidobacteriia bacterium]|nr:hypothetical protein [Terriglobia bacterium]